MHHIVTVQTALLYLHLSIGHSCVNYRVCIVIDLSSLCPAPGLFKSIKPLNRIELSMAIES